MYKTATDMKKILFAFSFALLLLAGCKEKGPVLDPVAEPSYFKNPTYFAEKNGMYEQLPVGEKDIVLVGDDYFDRGLWSEWFPNTSIKNRGITYDETAHVLYRIDRIAEGHPAKIFVSAGYYDVVRGVALDTVITNIYNIFERANKISPKTKLYYINIIGADMEGQKANDRDAVNAGILELSHSGLFEYIDVADKMRGGIQDGSYSYNGGNHLNGKGYEVFSAAFERQIGEPSTALGVDYPYADPIFPYYQNRASLFLASPANHHKIVMLGNSLNNNAPWNELFPGVDLINRGISGDVTNGIYQRAEEVAAHTPEKVFLLTGPNDLINDPQLSVEAFMASYKKVVDRLKELMPETQLFVHSILPVNPKSKFYEGYNVRAAEIDRQLAENAESWGYTFIDLVPAMADENGDLKDSFTTDGLHLTAEAYNAWVEVIKELVK